ncbi:MAG TPA: MarR family transcriptional regulator [Propionibacteriaceae bacterium]|nr:MarR family transcriptional regulator [Propionibacteriaceae bacterium]
MTDQAIAADRAVALDALRDVVLAAEQYRLAIASHFGLGQTEAQAVNHLSAGELGQSDLAKRLGITTGATTALVDRLELAGLAQRTAHPTDRRRMTVSLSDKGQAIVVEGMQSLNRIFEGFDDEQLDETIAALTSIANNMESESRALGWQGMAPLS